MGSTDSFGSEEGAHITVVTELENGTITRQDVMNTGLDKRAAEAKINAWIAAGLLEKQGHGRDTVYILRQRENLKEKLVILLTNQKTVQ